MPKTTTDLSFIKLSLIDEIESKYEKVLKFSAINKNVLSEFSKTYSTSLVLKAGLIVTTINPSLIAA